MTNARFLSLLASLLLAGCRAETPDSPPGPSSPPGPLEARPRTLSVRGLAAPESVLHDEQTDLYLVSNVSGDPFTADHDGFISRVAPDGTIVALRFIDGRASRDGLSAPKGMALVGRTLHVADIDRVRRFDADSGAESAPVLVPGASLLNDLCASPDGTVYVTDTGIHAEGGKLAPTGTDAIHALAPDGSLRRLASGPDLGRPNGLLCHDGPLEVVTLGSGEWLTLAPDGSIARRRKLPGAMLDGIALLPGGDRLVTSWDAPGLYLLHASDPPRLLATAPSPADLGLDRRRHRALVPLMTEDRLLIAPLP